MNAERATLLLVDDTPANIGVLFDTLEGRGYKLLVARSGEGALKQMKSATPDLVLLDVMMPEIDGYEICRRMKASETLSNIPVIFMTALSETEDKVRGFSLGAVDYITKPFQAEEVLARVKTQLRLRSLQADLEQENAYRKNAEQALKKANAALEERVEERTRELKEALEKLEQLRDRLQDEVVSLKEEISREHSFEEIIGNSEAVLDVLRQVQQVAPTESTVLITGESGTGKELFAQAIHSRSSARSAPLIKVNCGAIPANLVESELFGHEKGAFTGATQRRLGRFELANNGTLFLDEVGELPLETQVKLLRVLQEREFERVGASRTIRVDVRLIAATNRNLQEQVKKGAFREDLFYRLNVFPIELPPLRERGEDVELMAQHFLKIYSRKMGKRIEKIDARVMKRIRSYSWPGNVRELQNVMERAVILAQSKTLELEAISSLESVPRARPSGLDELEEMERKIFLKALQQAKWKIGGKGGAAEILDRPVSTVRDRIKKLELERPI